MNNTLPLAQWLNAPRPDDTPIAWLGEHTWTLGQLRYDVTALVGHLRQQEGDRWALCFENSYLFIVALLATLHAGKTPVIPGHTRVSLLEEQDALFSGVLSDNTLNFSGRLLVVSSTRRSMETFIPLPDIDGSRYVELFTSGSTGKPKRVIKYIASLDKEASMLVSRFGERLSGCRVIASVVPQHLYGLTFRIFLPMAAGLPLHAAMLWYAEQLAAISHDQRYVFISSPAFLKRIDHQLTPPPVAMILSAGGKLPWNDVTDTHAWLNIWPDEIYGSTETGILAWRYRHDDDLPWLPFPGVAFIAEGEEYRATSPLIHHEGGLLLDDIIHFDDDGLLRLAGRRGRVVKIEEKRISLHEIEQRLLELKGVREAAALPVSRGGRQGIGVLLVLDDDARLHWRQHGGKAQELAWRRSLIPWLEPVAVPRYWRVVDEIPVNSMNKRVYAQLQELFHENT